MEKHDFLYPLRSDISLAFSIENQTRKLIGCDYFVDHCFFESDNKNWFGNDYYEFSFTISRSIKELNELLDTSKHNLNSLSTNTSLTPIELFDYQSEKIYKRVPLDRALVFRLLLVQSQISYGLILVNEILNINEITTPRLWICFAAKLLAIKYDESFDNIDNMFKYASQKDHEYLAQWIKKNKLAKNNIKARKFAQSLRNTIHYQMIESHESLRKLSTTSAQEDIYCINSGVLGFNMFFNMLKVMIEESSRLQEAIHNLFGLEKKYDY